MTARLTPIDIARGVALLVMTAYHASWDATFLGLASFDLLGDPLWLAARTLILSSFLILSGISLVLATRDGLNIGRFLRRLGLLVAAAAAVSASSYLMFPDSPIFFGVLHHMAVAAVLGLAFVRLPWLVTAAAAVGVVLAGENLAFALFDHPWLRWVGLMTYAPESNDYVPLFPWFGGVLLGIAIGRLWRPGGSGADPAGRPMTALAFIGRHSLAFYLIHQPVLFGLLWLAAQGVTATEPATAREFLASCTATCTQAGGLPDQCAANCRCVREGLVKAGAWDAFIANTLDPRGRQAAENAVRACTAPR